MSLDAQAELKGFKPRHKYFVGIDSDGCAFDTMEVKHKECFIPNIIKYWELQAVSKYAREAAEFVNLYSKWRGINRFPALIMVLDLLRERPEVMRRKVKIHDAKPVKEWVKRETKLGNPVLEEEVKKTGDPVLKHTLEWSKRVNETIKDVVKAVPPFPFVRESLEKLSKSADIVVVSQTPVEALRREWEEHAIAGFAGVIAGQEMGTKKEHIALAAGGKYPGENILMIGDAYGDLEAARGNNARFFPVNPGDEEASWERFYKEEIDRFATGKYTKEHEESLLEDFKRLLPEVPPWKM